MKLGRFIYLVTGDFLLSVCNLESGLFFSSVKSRSERKLTYFNSVLDFPYRREENLENRTHTRGLTNIRR
jgi:hypothetical protein